MSTGILEPRTESPEAQPPASPPTMAPPAQERRRGLAVVSAVVALLGVYSIWGVQSGRSTLDAQRTALGDLSGRVESLTAENTTLKSQLAQTRSELDAARERLAAADEEAARARSLALRNQREAQRSADELGGAIDAQKAAVGTLSGSVDGVKSDLAANRQDLDRALADLGQQDGLIARNQRELEALKRSAGRDYFEFELRKSKAFTRIGPLAMRLNKTDDKHQRYTVTLVVNDKQVEKKDNALFEPVQFYMPGTRSVVELVAQEVADGRIVGYVSSPKQTTPLT
jgi:uncharacterized protein (DUF3084 family)